jgi:adenine-specific DNA-methyltransferase
MEHPEHIALETTNGSQLNIDALYQLFPSCFTEAADVWGKIHRAVDWGKLRELLGEYVENDEPEKYDFTWVGKRAAQREAAAPCRKTLRPCKEESVDWDTTQNLYIEGDNLEVLKLLQNSYMGKVKMIYIDPPYNTGNDFVYHDDFDKDYNEYDEHNKFEDGVRFWKNTDSNGRFHSDWCSMIYARLMVARSLLTEDGVIFISIDDNEVNNLRKMATEVFGETNFVAEMVWQGGKVNTARFISTSHEYILVFAKNLRYCADNNVVWKEHKKGLGPIYEKVDSLIRLYPDNKKATEKLKEWFKNEAPEQSKAHEHYCNIDRKGAYCMDNVSRVGGGKYTVKNPINGLIIQPPSRGWVYGKEADFWEAVKSGVLEFQDNDKLPILKRYLKDNELQLLDTVFYKDRRGAKIRLRSLMNGEYFDFPKDEEVIENLISAFTNADSLILDFFSGSATTAHAVMQLNAEDGGNRKFIMVQLPEETAEDSEAYKAGYKNICEIGKERIRRAGRKIKGVEEEPTLDNMFDVAEEESQNSENGLDIGFRVLKCEDSNFKDVAFAPKEYSQDSLDLFVDNIKEDRTGLDLLFDCMMRWGLELSLPYTEIEEDGCIIYNVDDGNLVACFDGEVTEAVIDAIAEMNPLRVVFRDSSFTEAAAKMNLFELFKQKCGWTDQEVQNNVRVI